MKKFQCQYCNIKHHHMVLMCSYHSQMSCCVFIGHLCILSFVIGLTLDCVLYRPQLQWSNALCVPYPCRELNLCSYVLKGKRGPGARSRRDMKATWQKLAVHQSIRHGMNKSETTDQFEPEQQGHE